jgi:hypothetical protein
LLGWKEGKTINLCFCLEYRKKLIYAALYKTYVQSKIKSCCPTYLESEIWN